jgi:hexosaminidase
MVFPYPLPLVPVPVSATAEEGRMPVATGFRIAGPAPAATQLIAAIERRSGIRLVEADGGAEIVLRVDSTVAASEGYTLTVGDRVEIIGADDAGLFYGLQTLLQLLRQDEDGSWGFLRAQIADAPRFPAEASCSTWPGTSSESPT